MTPAEWIIFLLITGIPLYIVSMNSVYNYFSIKYSKGGYWEYMKPSEIEIALVFIPAINTLFALIAWVFFYPIKDPPKTEKQFFNIRK